MNDEKLNKSMTKGFKKYFFNTSWLVAEKIIRLVIGLFVNIWVARYLGPKKLGLLNYSLAFISMFGFLVTLGMDSGLIVKELKTSFKDKEKILATSLFVKFIGALLAFSSIIIITQIVEKEPILIYLITIVSLSYFFRIFTVFDLYFQAKVLSKYIVISNLIAFLLASIIKVILINIHATIVAFAYIFVGEVLIASLFYIYYYIKDAYRSSSWSIDFSFAKRILQNSWPIMISAFLISIYMKIDIIMVKNMLGAVEVGNYSVATNISSILYFIPVVISGSVYPAILDAKKNNEELYYTRFGQLFNLTVLFMFPIALMVTFTSNFFINLLYTDVYQTAASVLSIHIWAGVFFFFNTIQWKWFITESLQKIALIIIVISTLINIILNLYLIPIFGINGAAMASLFSYACAGFIGNAFCSKTKKIFILQLKSLLFISFIKKLLNLRIAVNDLKFMFLHNFIIDRYLKKKGSIIIGDYHTVVFEYMIKNKKLPPSDYYVVKVPGATAQGAVNPKSKSNAFEIFKRKIKYMSKNSRVFIMLGEVDCGFVIWYRSEKYNVSIENQVHFSITNYEKFIKFLLSNGFEDVTICAVTFPTIKKGITKGAVVDERRSVKASRLERQNLTILYNNRLLELAKKYRLGFIDINNEIINNETGFIDDQYLQDDITDHHLSSEKIYQIWLRKLTKTIT